MLRRYMYCAQYTTLTPQGPTPRQPSDNPTISRHHYQVLHSRLSGAARAPCNGAAVRTATPLTGLRRHQPGTASQTPDGRSSDSGGVEQPFVQTLPPAVAAGTKEGSTWVDCSRSILFRKTVVFLTSLLHMPLLSKCLPATAVQEPLMRKPWPHWTQDHSLGITQNG